MRQVKRVRELIPPWNMPADPVKAVFWFMRWSLKVLVHFFWIPILGMVILETYLNWRVSGIGNGLVGGVVTLLVGIVVWAVLYVVLLFVNVSTGISRVFSDVSRLQHLQRNYPYRRPYIPFNDTDSLFNDARAEDNVVESTITDLEEERKKRRRADD